MLGALIGEHYSVCAKTSEEARPHGSRPGSKDLAPYWFDIQLTGYLGTDGRLAARAKVSYDMLLSNRLILTLAEAISIASNRGTVSWVPVSAMWS
jgi:uncharacterized protein involved in copper resistance